MADAYDEGVANLIRESIRKNTGRKVKGTQPWPGTPITHLPLVFSPTMHAMIRSGEIEIVSRAKVTDPSKTVSYIRLVSW